MFGLSKLSSKVPEAIRRIYLDHASATPVVPEVLAAMLPYFTTDFGNGSAIHTEGVRARTAVTIARTLVAKVLQIQPSNVIFTGSGTESNNLALLGLIESARIRGLLYSDMEIITTRIEHPATLRTAEHLASLGVAVHYAPIGSNGKIILSSFRELLSTKTIFVTAGYVNSEIGTIEDIGALARILHGQNKATGGTTLLHVDAAQAPLWLPCALSRTGADLVSLDAGKFGGPKGVGVLARGKNINLTNITHGGGQEGGLRPGTENVAGIVGLAVALELAQQGWQERQTSVLLLRDYFISQLLTMIPAVVVNGATGDDRVANNVNISIPGLDSEFAVVSLDVAGIACSTKSACSSAGGGESVVVKAVTGDSARATSTIRFTLGPNTTKTELDSTVLLLKQHVAEIRLF